MTATFGWPTTPPGPPPTLEELAGKITAAQPLLAGIMAAYADQLDQHMTTIPTVVRDQLLLQMHGTVAPYLLTQAVMR